MNIDKLLEIVNKMPSSDKMDLDSQIYYMELVNQIIKTPQLIAIYNSLKELRGIKRNQLHSKDVNYVNKKILYMHGLTETDIKPDI